MDSSWRPSASIEMLRLRANMLREIRDFFNCRGYLEVETPVLSHFGVTDVYLSNITALFRNETLYMQTSPEYHMKRLLAAGSGPIFQIARVFRDDELGRWHNPEFSLLEWYQLDIDHHQLLEEVDLLLQQTLKTAPLCKYTYREVFLEYCGQDPMLATIDELKQTLSRYQLDNVLDKEEKDKDMYLFLLMSHVIEPALGLLPTPVAVYDFPESQASLAKVEAGVAHRFEVYYRGVELLNGFHELTDPIQQKQRFINDLDKRRELGLLERDLDSNFLQALTHGLPACSGVALGLDRLLALALNQTSISPCIAFDFARS